MRTFWTTALQKHIIITAFRIALVVGTILNIINQGDSILTGQDVAWGHLAMNYIVPFCVATYSAVKNELTERGKK